MEALHFLIKSLKREEKRKFRISFSMKSRSQDFILLYDSLKRADSLPDQTRLAKRFGGEKKLKRIASDLASVLIDYLGSSSDAPIKKIVVLEAACLEALRMGSDEFVAMAVKKAVFICSDFDEWSRKTSLETIFNTLPFELQCEEVKHHFSISGKIAANKKRLKIIEEKLFEWPIDVIVPPPKISLLQEVCNELSDLQKEIISPKNMISLLTIKRKTYTILREYEIALNVSQDLMTWIKKSSHSDFEKERLILEEGATTGKLFGAMGMSDAFFLLIKNISPLNFRFPSLHRESQYQFHLISLAYFNSFGALENTRRIINGANDLLNNSSKVLSSKQRIILGFRLGKTHFNLGEYDIATSVFFQILSENSTEGAYQLYLPFIQMYRVLCEVNREEWDFEYLNSILSALKNIIKKRKYQYRYFDHFFSIIGGEMEFRSRKRKGPPEYNEIYRSLKELKNNDFESRPFPHLDLSTWIEAKIEGKYVYQICKERQKPTPKSIQLNLLRSG